MRKYGLIGKDIAHSYSPTYFAEKFYHEGIEDAIYALFPMGDPSELKDLLKEYPEICGLNVTIPYKESIIPFLDSLDEDAESIGAVNCIKILDSSTIGFNTDWMGFMEDLQSFPDIKDGDKALILGSGGASKAISYAFSKMNISYIIVSRKPGNKRDMISYSAVDKGLIRSAKIIVNTTPLGMYPDLKEYPDLPYEYLGKEHLLYDLIYNPLKTEFLKRGEENGARIKNGLNMLYKQAELSWQIWNQ